MGWTSLAFAYGSVLTSTKMTQLQDNFGYGAGSPNPTFIAPALGTPASGIATNLTGTASALSIGGNAATATPATTATTVTISDAGGDTTTFPLLGTAATGNLGPATDVGLTYNATTNALSTTTFVGALTGAASGNIPIDAGSEGVGLPMTLYNSSAGAVASGDVAAGSGLRFHFQNADGTGTASGTPTGTWRNITGVVSANGNIHDWQRIS